MKHIILQHERDVKNILKMEMSIEIYIDIPGYEGLYQASNWGNIKSLPRKRNIINEKILKPINHKGYFGVTLSKNNKKKQCRINRLILETFIGPCPPGMECRHLDGDRRNNRLDNLCWGTHRENVDDKIIHNTNFNGPKGSKCPWAILNDIDILEIKKLIKKEIPCAKIAKIFNVSRQCITDIKFDRTWRHIYA